MRRRIIPTRLIAITLAVALFLGNDYTIFPLADVSDSISDGGTTEPQPITTEIGGEPIVQSGETPASTNGDNGTSNDDNGTSNGDNGTSNDDNGTSNDDNGTSNGDNGTSNGDNGTSNGDNGTSNGDNGTSNGDNGTSNDDNGTSNDNNNECQVSEDGKHHWVVDTENGGEKCEACGIPKPDDENENTDDENENTDECPNSEDGKHHWVEDTENGGEKCESCGIPRPDDENEYSDVCPKSPTGKHLWLVTSNTCIFCGIEKPKEDPVPVEPECEHEWVTDPETGLTTCINCGIEKPEEEEECEHEWVTDPETGITTCIKCGIEKPEEECDEHEWIRDPETLQVVCGICGVIDEDYVEEDPCPESKWGFHIYAENEDGTGYVCVLCGAEKEELDPLDVTEEMFMNSKLAIATLAMKNGVSYDSREASRFPQYGGTYTLEDLENYANKDDGYYTLEITCVGDLLVIEDWCKETDFSGWRFLIMQRTTGTTPNVGVSDYNWNLTSVNTPSTEDKFTGWGSEKYPFAGIVQAVYRDNSNFTINTSFFKYLSTNATVDGMSFIGSMSTSTSNLSNDPMGLVAGTLVKDKESDADCVTLKDVRLRGTVASAKAAGMVFGRVEARNGTSITLFDDTAEITMGWNGYGYVYGLHAGGFAGETEGDVTVNINDPSVFSSNYTVYIYSGSGSTWGYIDGKLGDNYANTPAGGAFIGAMDKGILNIAPNSYKTSVSTWRSYYGANGGLVGMAIGTEVNAVGTSMDSDGCITVTGSVSGYYAGGVLGYYEHPTDVDEQILTLDYIKVTASTSGNYYAGGVLGRYYRNIENATVDGVYDVIDHATVSGTVYVGSSSYYGGGVVGFVHGSNLMIGGDDPENTANERRISVSSTMYGGNMGGVVGVISGQYVEIHNVSASPYFRYSSSYAYTQGGIIGYVGRTGEADKKTIVRITDVSTSGTYGYSSETDTKTRGGILGEVSPGSMVALDGSINVSMSFSCYYSYTLYAIGRNGYVAGTQKEALIYLEEDAVYTRSGSTSNICTDDIGNYGGVYRNGAWGESGQIFSYEEAKVLGKVGGSGSNWTIDSEADLIRLAVMLNTQGRFAADCFGYTPAENKGTLASEKGELLKAIYTLSSPTGTLDLRGSGVYSLNRNDSTGFNESFTGTFMGSKTGSDSLTINLGDITTHQAYIALFPQIGEGAVISDFTLKRTINGVSIYGAGIACLSKGKVTLKNLYMDLTSDANASLVGINGFEGSGTSYWRVYDGSSNITWYTARQYFAGLVAKVEAGSAITFEVENIKIDGKLNGYHAYSSYYGNVQVGGLIADYTGTNTTISVKNVELMKNFGIKTVASYRFGGLIADINYDVSGTSNQTTLFIRDIKVHNGASISQTSSSSTYSCGGWLGNVWKNVIPNKTDEGYYSVANVTIGDGGTAAEGPQYSAGYSFGGLVNTVTGRIQMKDTWIQNGVFNNAGSQDGVGLMFRVGNDAIIEIDGYKIADRGIDGDPAYNNGGAVQFLNVQSTTRNYDEIVAYNMGPSAGNFNDYKNGGIVNIIYPGFSDGNGHHKVYQNRLVKPNNLRRTRYYYNLFGSNFKDEDNYLGGTFDGTTVTNEKQMMIWHLNQYMNSSIRSFLGVYYDNETPISQNTPTTFVASSKIDLDTVSYYPTPVTSASKYTFGSDSVTTEIVFHGQDITTNATATMTPSNDNTEHYMLHAGLFVCKDEIEVTVQGHDVHHFLVLSGSVSNLSGDTDTDNVINENGDGRIDPDTELKNNSGAIFVRDIKGKKNIYYVRFNGLYLADYTNEDPAGLMLGIVKDGATLDISWIETRNYDTLFKRDKAASALIAVVGDYEASKISIEFKNMNLDGRKNGGIFMYASLIDENYYKEDTENASADIRRLRYLFTKEAWLGTDGTYYNPFNEANEDIYGANTYEAYGVGSYVTIGYELGEGIEYWNVDYGPENPEGGWSSQITNNGKTVNAYDMLNFAVDTFIWDQTYIETNYIPYVHRVQTHTSSKDIEVNPKNRSILKGCGTYEDPYIIEHPRQLLALARYLQNKNDYKYLENWQIHDFEYGRLENEDPDARKNHVCDQNHTYTGQDDPDGSIQESDTQLRTYTFKNGTVNPDFPTQDELSQAYYMIVGDIDLAHMSNATDRQIAEDFVGLGTSKIPFRGVIVGEINKGTKPGTETNTTVPVNKDSQGRPTLTLPLKGYWTAQSKDVNYGLIQYSIGTVVKDLVIEASTEVDTVHERTGVAKVENKAAGVMAIVIGGDNIIDNVSVEAYITLMSEGCCAGAYAGIVEQGSLILRNIPEDCAKKFYIGTWNTPKTSAEDVWDAFTAFDTAKLKKDYQYVAGLIGKVEDGCVIYDDVYGGKLYGKSVIEHSVADHAGGTSEAIAGIYSNVQNMPICNHYDIIVKSELDNDMDIINNNGTVDNNEKIQVTYDSAANAYTAQIETSAQLQIVSMVINSDAFSIYPAEGGYKKEAACRKADYKYVGKKYQAGTTEGNDRDDAVRDDDRICYYPYLYQYFNFNITSKPTDGDRLGNSGWQATLKAGTYPRKVKNDNGTITTEQIEGYVSTLNVATSDITEVMNYKLNGTKHGTENTAYDLEQYCRGFRGIGATYGMLTTKTETSPYNTLTYGEYDSVDEDAFYSDFRANFDGDNAWIKLGLDKSYDQTIHTTALFNDLLDRNASANKYFTIENFVVTGSSQSIVPEIVKDETGDETDKTDGNGSYPNRTAAVVGLMRRPWRMYNIKLQNMEVVGKGHTGGVVAWIEPGASTTYTDENGEEQTIKDYEFIGCTLDANTRVYSYGGSAGGIIAVVMKSDPTLGSPVTSANNAVTVNLYGCQINGEEDNQVEIAVKNRTKDDTIDPYIYVSSTYYRDYGTKRGVGRSGGFIGYVGRRNNANLDSNALIYVNVVIDKSDASTYSTLPVLDAEVEYAKLTGAYSTGGLIGTYDAGYTASSSSTTTGRTVTIKSAAVENCAVEGLRGNVDDNGNASTSDYYYTHGVGGLIGEMRGGELTIHPGTSQNISLKDTTVLSSQTSGAGLYAGGMVGCLKVYKGRFINITMGASESLDEVLVDKVGTKGWVRSCRSDAGGIIGCASYGAGTLYLSGVQVIGMDISCDNRKDEQRDNKLFETDNASGTNGYVGGLIGTNHISLVVKQLNDETTTDNDQITTDFGAKVQECLITAPYYAVGGIVGIASNNSGAVTYYTGMPTSISDITVEKNIIGYNNAYVFTNNVSYASAGGVLGTIDAPYSSNYSGGTHRVENAEINDNWIYGYRAGGVIGYATNYGSVYSNYKETKKAEGATGISVNHNDIYGLYVGGAIGYGGTVSLNYYGTQITNNHLQAYGSGNSTTAYVGGYAGYVTSSSAYYLDYIDVKENDILAGSAPVNGYASIYAGGLIGYVSTSTTKIYRPKLTNNNIGYSETGVEGVGGAGTAMRTAAKEGEDSRGFATLAQLVDEMHDTRTVKLLIPYSSGLIPEAMPTSIDDLATNGIGYYGARIGNYIGSYSSSNTLMTNTTTSRNNHTYILAPEYSYAANVTRPVIDVGLAAGTSKGADPAADKATLLTSPYAYRQNVHIIYHDYDENKTDDAAKWVGTSTDGSKYYVDNPHYNGSSRDDDWKYLFEGMDYDTLIKDYQDAKNGTSGSVADYLEAYRLGFRVSDTQTVEEVYNNLYRDINDGLKSNLQSEKGKSPKTVLPVIFLDTQYGTPDELMNGVIAALTGAGGVQSVDGNNAYADQYKGIGTITTITTKRWVLEYSTGRLYEESNTTDKKPSLQATRATATSANNYSTGYTFTYDHFDDNGIDPNSTEQNPPVERDQTFTMVTIDYSWSSNGQTRKETIHIPVFVEERLIIDTHLKITEGLEYNVEKASKGYYLEQITVASDSSYTFYTEYIYGEARKKYKGLEGGIGEKYIGTYSYDPITGETPQTFGAGTRLTLIDIDAGNKVYYYTATGEEEGYIKYTDFTTEPGGNVHYQYKDIGEDTGFLIVGKNDPHITEDVVEHTVENKAKGGRLEPERDTTSGLFKTQPWKYENVAVERFLILVDISSELSYGELDPNSGTIREVAYPLVLKNGVRARTTLTEHTLLSLNIVQGMTIRFIQKFYDTTDPYTNGSHQGDKALADWGERTWIGGTVTANEESGFVDIYAAIEVSASGVYWAAVRQSGANTIDSANHDKYLELQIYMTEENSEEEIMLPLGTFGYIEGERTRPEELGPIWFGDTKDIGGYNYMDDMVEKTGQSDWYENPENVPPDHFDTTDLDPYYNVSNVYYYKDGRVLYRLNDLSKIIAATETRSTSADPANYRSRANRIVWVDHVRLDFRNADMTPFDQSRYIMRMNLLRIEDPDYPAGGEVKDTYSNQLPAVRDEELACALEAKDLMQLGINLYDNQTPIPHDIEFEFKMDFSGVMTGIEKTDEVMANKYYTAAYRIWQKQFAEDGSYEYVPYNGDELELVLVDDPGDKLDAAGKKQLQSTVVTVKPKNNEVDGVTGGGDSSNVGEDEEQEVKFWYANYQFKWDEIEKGTKKYYGWDDDDTEDDTSQGGTIEDDDETETKDSKGKGVILRNLNLKVNSVDELDLSNYRVQVILNVSDCGYNVPGVEMLDTFELNLDPDLTPLTDFFVFTIAKLKTDLDY